MFLLVKRFTPNRLESFHTEHFLVYEEILIIDRAC